MIRHIVFSILFCLFSLTNWAQQTISAHVVDRETGEALPYVTVYVSQEKGTLTNLDGDFSLEANADETLQFSCIGYNSLRIKVSELTPKIEMKPLAHSLKEVTVMPVERILMKVLKRLNKEYGVWKRKESRYFYRLTNEFAGKNELAEAFLEARSAVNMRRISFLAGRRFRENRYGETGTLFSYSNLHHLMELAPCMRDSAFWEKLFVPIPANADIKYFGRHYNYSCQEMTSEDGKGIYKIEMSRKGLPTLRLMTGTLYIDKKKCQLLKFEGDVANYSLDVTRSMRNETAPIELKFSIEYSHRRKFTEVARISSTMKCGDMTTKSLVYNIGKRKLKLGHKQKVADNMLEAIDLTGTDTMLWNQEVVKRTAEEEGMIQEGKFSDHPGNNIFSKYLERLKRFGETIPQEKVYVHMDNTSYFHGDTIWFAAYTRQSTNDCPSKVSGLLYVELLNQDGYLVERKLIEMTEGRGNGFFALNRENIYSGFYELRAYTRWQLNWGIQEHPHSEVSKRWFLTEECEKDFFRDYEKLYSRVFPVYDRPEKKGEFTRQMTMRHRHQANSGKGKSLTLNLYPEGGNLVAGVPNRVAFEAAWNDGEWADGTLLVGNDSFPTLNRGRGEFTLTPKENEELDITFVSKEGKKAIAEIFQPNKMGVAIRVDIADGKFRIGLHMTGNLNPDSLGMTVMHEGVVEKFFQPSQKESVFYIEESDLNVGVNQVTVFDSQGRIWADRLFFVMGSLSPTFEITGKKSQYNPYELIALNVKGKCPQTPFSISVHDVSQTDQIFDNGNILTEMLLCSEIHGFVPNPEWYFEKNDEEHRQALDLLMMTQGWRRFNWRDMAVRGAWDLTQPDERTITLTGEVLNANIDSVRNKREGLDHSYKLTKEVRVHSELIPFSNMKTVVGETETRDGRFRLRLPRFNGQSIFFIAASDTTKWEKGYEHLWIQSIESNYSDNPEEEESFISQQDPAEFFVRLTHPYPRFVKPYSHYQQMLSCESYDSTRINFLYSKGKSPEEKKEFDDSAPVLVVDALSAENESKDAGIIRGTNYTIQSYLGDFADGEYLLTGRYGEVISRTQTRYGLSSEHRSLPQYIDIPQDSIYYGKYLRSFPVDEIKGNTLMKKALEEYNHLESLDKYIIYSNFSPRNKSQNPINPKEDSGATIVIYPLPDGGRRTLYRDRRYVLSGFAYPAEFYSPDYSKQTPPDPTDYRRTLYWNPNLQLDENGQARITFYNNSRTTQISVEAEGQASDGTLLWSK